MAKLPLKHFAACLAFESLPPILNNMCLYAAAQPDDPSQAPGARLRQAVAKQQPDIVPGLDMSDTQEVMQHASSMERSRAAQRPLEQVRVHSPIWAQININ